MSDKTTEIKNMAAAGAAKIKERAAQLSLTLGKHGVPVDIIAQQRDKAVKWVSENKGRVIGGLVITAIINTIRFCIVILLIDSI